MFKSVVGLGLVLFAGFHPVHVSVLNIDEQKDKNILSLTFKLFPDDFRMVAFHRYGDRIDSTAVKDTANSDRFVNAYIQSMVFLVANKKDTLKIGHVERKYDGENLWLSCEVPTNGEIKEFHVTNYVLMDIFGDQTNLVIVQINGQERGVSLDAWKPEADLSFTETNDPKL